MESGIRYTEACLEVVTAAYTIKTWREKHPRLDRYFKKLMHRRDDNILRKIETSLEGRLIDGKASAAELIFYLCNRASQRWKNSYKIEHSGKIEGRPERIVIHIENINKDKAGDNSKNRLSKLLENND